MFFIFLSKETKCMGRKNEKFYAKRKIQNTVIKVCTTKCFIYFKFNWIEDPTSY